MSAGVRGILFMVAGCALIVFNDVIVKLLTEQYPVGQAMFVRSLFVIPPVLLFALYEGKLANLRVHNFKGQALRSVIVVTGMFLFLTAITMMPIADALAITFAAPLMATALAVPLLGERVGWRRWSAVVVGLAGVILVLRPTGEGIAVVALLPLGSAITLALRDILTRRLSVSDSSSSILMFTTLAVMGTSLASSLADPLLGWTAAAWQPIAVGHVAMLAVAGVLLAGAQYSMIEAVRLAEIGLVAPFKYTSMVWAVLTGYLVFDTVPDIWIISGSTLVVASGLYMLHREATLKKDRRTVPQRPETTVPQRAAARGRRPADGTL